MVCAKPVRSAEKTLTNHIYDIGFIRIMQYIVKLRSHAESNPPGNNDDDNQNPNQDSLSGPTNPPISFNIEGVAIIMHSASGSIEPSDVSKIDRYDFYSLYFRA